MVHCYLYAADFMLQNAEQFLFIMIYHSRFNYSYNKKEQGPHELENKVFGHFLVA